jgi:hypothetical protein
MFLSRQLRHIAVCAIKLQPMLASQPSDEFLIRIRLHSAQPVVEMSKRYNDAKFAPQFDQQTQERNRINPARNRNPNPVSGSQHFLPPDVAQHALRQFVHRTWYNRNN